MKYLRLALPILLFLNSACLRTTGEKCTSILTSETLFQDSIPSELKMDDGIYAVSIKLKGKLENDIQFNEFTLPAGNIDTLITNRDYYSPTFHYRVSNEAGGNVGLDVCVGFAYSPL